MSAVRRAPGGARPAREPFHHLTRVTPQLSILHIMAPGAAGGLETVVRLLAAGHARAGHSVHVAAVLDGGGEFAGEAALRAAGVEVHRLALPGRAYVRERREVAALCRRVRPVAVHTHGSRPDVVDAGVARGLGHATVTTVHGFTGGDWRNRLYERLQRAAFRRFDAVVAVSRPLARELERAGIAPPRLHVVPNAYAGARDTPLDRAAARRRLGVADELFRIGWVGRVSTEKGPDVLVRALAEVRDLPVSVSVIGDGGERPSVAALARALGVADRLTWHGTMPDAAALFPAFDVLVLSSRTEGTPMVLFEAMAAGVPVVATRIAGIPELVEDGVSGFLVPPDDSDTLAAKVATLLDDPDLRTRFAAAGRAKVERDFNLSTEAARMALILTDATGGRGAAVGADSRVTAPVAVPMPGVPLASA